jgi:hypothetical protein
VVSSAVHHPTNKEDLMPDIRPLTSQEIDDGWQLDELPPPQAAFQEEAPYEEYVLEERNAPTSAFEQAFWEQHEGKKLARRFGEASPGFGKRPRARGTAAPPTDAGN